MPLQNTSVDPMSSPWLWCKITNRSFLQICLSPSYQVHSLHDSLYIRDHPRRFQCGTGYHMIGSCPRLVLIVWSMLVVLKVSMCELSIQQNYVIRAKGIFIFFPKEKEKHVGQFLVPDPTFFIKGFTYSKKTLQIKDPPSAACKLQVHGILWCTTQIRRSTTEKTQTKKQ